MMRRALTIVAAFAFFGVPVPMAHAQFFCAELDDPTLAYRSVLQNLSGEIIALAVNNPSFHSTFPPQWGSRWLFAETITSTRSTDMLLH
jgi:hypothetical protein